MSYSTDLLCFSYSCSTQNDDVIKELSASSMVLLPESILFQIEGDEDISFPLFFNIKNKESSYGYVCGVKSFTSPPGVCHVPFYIMQQIGINEGDTINIELVDLPEGDYIKIRPHKTEFINLSNPKSILERMLSLHYPVVTQGHTISIYHETLDKNFLIDIVETKPAESIKIINKNINLDFDTPLDYVEPPKPKPSIDSFTNKKINDNTKKVSDYKKTKNFVAFSGKGYRLGNS